FTLFGRGLAGMLGTVGAVNLGRAEKDVSRALVIEPTIAEGHRVLAELHLREAERATPATEAKLRRKAEGRLSRALGVREGYAPALDGAWRLARAQGKPARARDLLEDLLRQRPGDLEARTQLGKILWDTGDADGAFRELQRVVRHRP